MKLRPQTIMSVNISGNWRSSVESHTPLIWIPNSRGAAVGGTQSDTPEKPQNSASLREKAFNFSQLSMMYNTEMSACHIIGIQSILFK